MRGYIGSQSFGVYDRAMACSASCLPLETGSGGDSDVDVDSGWEEDVESLGGGGDVRIKDLSAMYS